MYNNTQSRRHRWEDVKERRDHPYGLNVRGLSVPVGCILDHAPDVPFTLDGGNTWISPRTGLEVKPCVGVPVPYVDRYGHVVYVQQPVVFSPPQQVKPKETDTLVNTRTGEKYEIERTQQHSHTFDTIFGSPPQQSIQRIQMEQVVRPPVQRIQVERVVRPSVQPVYVEQIVRPMVGDISEQVKPAPRIVEHSQPVQQTGRKLHPSIVETGKRDAFSSREIVTFKGVECHVPNGTRTYVYDPSGTKVTIIVGTCGQGKV